MFILSRTSWGRLSWAMMGLEGLATGMEAYVAEPGSDVRLSAPGTVSPNVT